MHVEHVDFVSVLTRDIPRAKRFYAEVLGLELESEGESDMEFRCGQVTLDVFDPSSIGQPFAPSLAGLALRVENVDAARVELEAKGVEFDGETVETRDPGPVLTRLAEEQKLDGISVRTGTLEDVFLSLTGREYRA